MKRLLTTFAFSLLFFSCEKNNLVQQENSIQTVSVTPMLNASINDGRVHFKSLSAMEQTVAYLIENPSFDFSSLDAKFNSFYSKRKELETLENKPSQEIFNKYFREVLLNGELVILPSITDNVFEKILDEDGYFEISNELFFIDQNGLFKRNSVSENESFRKVSDLEVKVESLNAGSGANLREVNGGGYFSCGNTDYRLLGNLVNFNIGIYQRLSIQVEYKRKNKSFWSWIDPWLAEYGSLSYNASFTIQPSGGPQFQVNLSDNCGNCDGFNRTVDWNIGTAGPTQWSNQSGSFGGNVACGYRSYTF